MVCGKLEKVFQTTLEIKSVRPRTEPILHEKPEICVVRIIATKIFGLIPWTKAEKIFSCYPFTVSIDAIDCYLHVADMRIQTAIIDALQAFYDSQKVPVSLVIEVPGSTKTALRIPYKPVTMPPPPGEDFVHVHADGHVIKK